MPAPDSDKWCTGDVDWCNQQIGPYALTNGRHESWDHFADHSFQRIAARLVASASGDFDGDGQAEVVVAVAVEDSGQACTKPPCGQVEWHLYGNRNGMPMSIVSRSWPAVSAVTLELSLRRVTAHAGEAHKSWVFDRRPTASRSWPAPLVAPPRCSPGGNAACASYPVEVAGVWSRFDWCNQLDTGFGRFVKGRSEYAEADAKGRHLDASRLDAELLRIGFGDFDGDGQPEAALASRESESAATSGGFHSSTGYALTLYAWDRARPRELMREEFPLAGSCQDLSGMAVTIKPGLLSISGSANEPRYEWIYDQLPTPLSR